MPLLENIAKTYVLNGTKIFLYPFILSFVGGILCGLIVGKLPEMFSPFIYAVFFGVLLGLLSKIYNLHPVVVPNLILVAAVLFFSFLTLFAALYFGRIFSPIIAANILFAVCLFLIDSFFYGSSLKNNLIILYFLSGLLAVLIIHIFILIDLKASINWLYIIVYPTIIYIYSQTCLLCRLMFTGNQAV